MRPMAALPDSVRLSLRNHRLPSGPAVRAASEIRCAEAPAEAKRGQRELGDGGRHPAVFQGRELRPEPGGPLRATFAPTEQREHEAHDRHIRPPWRASPPDTPMPVRSTRADDDEA